MSLRRDTSAIEAGETDIDAQRAVLWVFEASNGDNERRKT